MKCIIFVRKGILFCAVFGVIIFAGVSYANDGAITPSEPPAAVQTQETIFTDAASNPIVPPEQQVSNENVNIGGMRTMRSGLFSQLYGDGSDGAISQSTLTAAWGLMVGFWVVVLALVL